MDLAFFCCLCQQSNGSKSIDCPDTETHSYFLRQENFCGPKIELKYISSDKRADLKFEGAFSFFLSVYYPADQVSAGVEANCAECFVLRFCIVRPSVRKSNDHFAAGLGRRKERKNSAARTRCTAD